MEKSLTLVLIKYSTIILIICKIITASSLSDWRPVGIGDPLKDDPTHEYRPPVIDRLGFWGSPPQQQLVRYRILPLPSSPVHQTIPHYKPMPPPIHFTTSRPQYFTTPVTTSESTSTTADPESTIIPPALLEALIRHHHKLMMSTMTTPATTTTTTTTPTPIPPYVVIQGHSRVKKYGISAVPFTI